MLTFEKVLEVFADYLEQDADYEVILTKHGYTVMGFDDRDKDWSDIKLCETPEEMRDALLDAYENYLEYTTAAGQRNQLGKERLTEQEALDIQEKLKALRLRCGE